MSEMVPKIRFQGFTDAWERRKLDDVLTERNIQQPQTSEYPLVSFTVEKGVTPKTERYEREQLVVGDTKSKKYKITEFNDIVYNPANLKFGAISRNSYGKAVFSPIYVTFVVDEQIAYPKFMEMFVTRPDFIQHALKYQQGTVYERQSVSPENLLSMNLLLPIKDEQSQIGLFFQKFDDIINFHQRKLDLLKEQKKGFLQKMFPKDGQIVPEIRFAGFTDDWEERKSKDIFKPKIRKGEPDLPVLSVTQTSGVVYRDEVGIDIKYDISTLKNYKVIEPNDFVISLRSFQGGFELSDKLGITSPAYTIFVPKSPEEQNNLFWRIQFKRFQFIQTLKTVTFGIRDGKSISFNEFGDLKIKFPSNILEQQKIGAFFKELDNTIALHQRKLDLLKEQKKGFLQKMFVS